MAPPSSVLWWYEHWSRIESIKDAVRRIGSRSDDAVCGHQEAPLDPSLITLNICLGCIRSLLALLKETREDMDQLVVSYIACARQCMELERATRDQLPQLDDHHPPPANSDPLLNGRGSDRAEEDAEEGRRVCHADEGGKEEEEEEDEDGEGTGEDNAGCSSSDTDRHVPQPHVKQRCCKKKRDGSNRYRLVTLQNLYGHPEGRAPTHFVVDGPPGGTASFAVDEGQDDSSSRQSTLDRRLVDVALSQVEPPGGEDNPCASRVNKRTGTSTLARFWYRITRMFHRKRVHENGRPRLDK